jgi:bifunctional DNA-binding transcriptional regulator/antitoxin component of YhaV-PrlF toxin-antitoxin module
MKMQHYINHLERNPFTMPGQLRVLREVAGCFTLTVPKRFVDKLGLKAGDYLEITEEIDHLKVSSTGYSQGQEEKEEN